jgi:hypothetical protein
LLAGMHGSVTLGPHTDRLPPVMLPPVMLLAGMHGSVTLGPHTDRLSPVSFVVLAVVPQAVSFADVPFPVHSVEFDEFVPLSMRGPGLGPLVSVLWSHCDAVASQLGVLESPADTVAST